MAPPSGGWACLEFQPDRDPRTKRLAVMFIRHRRGGGGWPAGGPGGVRRYREKTAERRMYSVVCSSDHTDTKGPSTPNTDSSPLSPQMRASLGGPGRGKGWVGPRVHS